MANTQEEISKAVAEVPSPSREEIKKRLRQQSLAVLADVRAGTKVEKVEVDKFTNNAGLTFIELTFTGSLSDKWKDYVTKRGNTKVIKVTTPLYNVAIWKDTIAAADRGTFAQDSTCEIVNVLSFPLGSKSGCLYDEGVKAFGYSVRYLKPATPATSSDSAPAKVYK